MDRLQVFVSLDLPIGARRDKKTYEIRQNKMQVITITDTARTYVNKATNLISSSSF